MSEPTKKVIAWEDPIVAEVHSVREALFAAAGNDIREYCRRARERQAMSKRPVVTRGSGELAAPPSRRAG
jgi:hypothetical protein